jgi:hypothetical protein
MTALDEFIFTILLYLAPVYSMVDQLFAWRHRK